MIHQVCRFVTETKVAFGLAGAVGASKWTLAAISAADVIWKTGSLAVADRAMGSAFRVRLGDTSIAFDPGDFGVCREILGHDCYRLRPLQGRIRTAIDLGCNCGTFTLMAAALNPGCRILAVDANPEFTQATLRNASANGFGDHVDAWTRIVGCSSVDSVRQLEVESDTEKFDPIRAIALLGGCDFLKCDVEGGEHALFNGDLEWLRRVSYLAVEYHWNEADGDRLEAVLRKEGFVIERQPHRDLGYLFGSRPV
jgi:FkbM family methyltransferase